MTSQPAIKPTVIVPDTVPLIHLAAREALHVLTAMDRVIVVDVVVLEATYDPGKPYALLWAKIRAALPTANPPPIFTVIKADKP
jgi:hypothetical protein